MKIHTKITIDPTAIVVTLSDDHLDASNVKQFKELMQPLISAHQLILVDLGNVNFIDSSGLGALLSCLRGMNNKDSQFKLINLTRSVRALLELVRMHRVFDIYNNEAEALA